MTKRNPNVERRVECGFCGKSLTGNQRLWCSRKCKTRAFNSSGYFTPEYWREYYRTHREERRDQQRALWAKKTPEDRHAVSSAQYGRRADKNREYQRRWRLENHDKKLDHNALRRVREANGGDGNEPVNRIAVFERDGWICQLCLNPVDPGTRGRYDPKKASLDHIIPVSRGGKHTMDNVQLAHLGCNLSKGARAALGVAPGQEHT